MTTPQIEWSRIVSRRVLVLGDVILDRYTWGNAERVSPEAPVLVLRADDQEVRPGGAASVAALLSALGAKVALAGVVGGDPAGRTLRRLLDEANVDHTLVVSDRQRPTTTKERFLGRAANRHPHQILRVDHEVQDPIGPDTEDRLKAGLIDSLPRMDAVLVSDYAKGACTPGLLEAVIRTAQAQQVSLLVDPARLSDYERYQGAPLILPNRVEAELVTGIPVTSPSEALRAGAWLCDRYGFAAALIKLDADGIALVDCQTGIKRHVTTRPRAVYDVTGAGDMVLAIAGLCQAAGRDLGTTAELANAAAGVEVEKLGVAPVSWPEIRAEVQRGRGNSKVVPVHEMVTLAESYHRLGKTVVFTNGCFDLLHMGHVTHLKQAAELGDVLVVAINSDVSVRRLKGPGRPVIPQDDRAAMLGALACVDHVLVFAEDTPHALLRGIRPDVLAKGGTTAEVVGREVVKGYGGRVCVTDGVKAVSTTALVSSIRSKKPIQV